MRKQSSRTPDEVSLERVLFAFRRKLSEIVRKESEYLHCPVSHIDALAYITEKGSPSMKDIADHLKITPPSTTAIIEAMQKKKLVTRVLNNRDRRTIRVALTPRAWKFFKILHERKLAVLAKMLSKLNSADQKQFIRLLTILIKE